MESRIFVAVQWITGVLVCMTFGQMSQHLYESYNARNQAYREWQRASAARTAFTQVYVQKCESGEMARAPEKLGKSDETISLLSFVSCARKIAADPAALNGLSQNEAVTLADAISNAEALVKIGPPWRWL